MGLRAVYPPPLRSCPHNYDLGWGLKRGNNSPYPLLPRPTLQFYLFLSSYCGRVISNGSTQYRVSQAFFNRFLFLYLEPSFELLGTVGMKRRKTKNTTKIILILYQFVSIKISILQSLAPYIILFTYINPPSCKKK